MRPPPRTFTAPAVESSASLRAALCQLLRARNYALQLRLDVWAFAVEIDALHQAGIDNSDLRILAYLGYVEHALERTPPGESDRIFRRTGKLTLNTNSCFVLTDKGLTLLQSDASLPDPTPSTESHSPPQWDVRLRELRLDGVLVKQFKVPAPNQELILSAFEEEGWPSQMDDPLPPLPGQCPKRRLSDSIWCLNRNQKSRLIRFAGNGDGRGLRWGRVS
jgi:hypothetical protein